jgi:predicted RNase H-like nuclease
MPGTDKARARRGSSVFPAPDRRLLPYATYAEATAFSKQNCASGLSQQCFHIFKKIAEVDALITPAMQSRLFEVHPELSFLAASGSQPLQHSKRRPEGYEERRRILARHFPTAKLPPRAEIRQQVPGATARDVQPDDILDAMIAAWTALRRSQGQHQTIPAIPEHDPRGLRMEIIY